jgi:hypothetical protein
LKYFPIKRLEIYVNLNMKILNGGRKMNFSAILAIGSILILAYYTVYMIAKA